VQFLTFIALLEVKYRPIISIGRYIGRCLNHERTKIIHEYKTKRI